MMDIRDAWAWLWTLGDTVDLLIHSGDRSTAHQLSCRATALIFSLSEEIDELMLCVSGDNYPVHAFRVVSH
jgi:hypothetical protein